MGLDEQRRSLGNFGAIESALQPTICILAARNKPAFWRVAQPAKFETCAS
jgi:hypothetical protein